MSNAKGQIIVLSGPSGCGKNTIYDALCARLPALAQTVSATTRAPREGERDGVDYYFLTKEEFAARRNAGEFIESVRYGDNLYGTLRCEVERLTGMQKQVMLIIEVNGAGNIKKAFPEAITIFIMPPSCEVLRERICGRGQMDENELRQRMEIAEREMAARLEFDYCVVNDDLKTCVDEIYEIIKNEGSKSL